MAFTFNDNDRIRLSITGITASFAPTSAVLAVDATEYTCSLTATGAGPYTIGVTTSNYFAGPAHPTPAGAVVLAYGVHTIEARLTGSDGTTKAIEYPAFRIEP